jgi:hypothetical protein
MLMWVLALAGSGAGLFYGLWQHARASSLEHERDEQHELYIAAIENGNSDKRRLEAVIADLKQQLKYVEEATIHAVSDSDLRARLNNVLGAPATAAKA